MRQEPERQLTRPREAGAKLRTRVGIGPATSANRSGTGTSRASAMAWIITRVGLALPDSIRLTYVRNRSQRSANSSWVKPRSDLSDLTRRPN
jgi:hypothetical protein